MDINKSLHKYCQQISDFDSDGICNKCGFHEYIDEIAEWVKKNNKKVNTY